MISKTAKSAIVIASVIGLIGACSAVAERSQTSSNLKNTGLRSSLLQIKSGDSKSEPITKTKTEVVEQEIPFSLTTIQDGTLEKGKTRVVSDGSNGIEVRTYLVTYTDGVETSRALTNVVVSRQPVDRVIAEGTYVAPTQSSTPANCQNGTYVNSAGQTVCRPSAIDTGGATAICRDGSYSYSRSRRGTCSHHGGVRQWL